jgi:phage gpG-like protein
LIEITVDAEQALLYIDTAGGKLNDLSVPLREILMSEAKLAQGRILSKGPAPDGVPWLPPSVNTKYGPGEGLLFRSGLLFDSLTPEGSGNVLDVTPSAGVLGTLVPYAAFQQEGTLTIPARAFLGWDIDQLPAYEKILGVYAFGE